MSKSIEIVKSFAPSNEQEAEDQKFFIECEEKEQILTRDNKLAHITCTALIVNKEFNRVLCVFHNIYKSWCWVGGHADGEDDPLGVALRESREETSIKDIEPFMQEPISIDSLPVASHFRRGKFVPAHTHLNITYLVVADDKQRIHIQADENSKVGWLSFDELIEKSTEPHMISVYKKIFERIKKIKR